MNNRGLKIEDSGEHGRDEGGGLKMAKDKTGIGTIGTIGTSGFRSPTDQRINTL